MGLDGSSFDIDRLEFYGKVNLMKGGILSADIITTVSPTYCAEIQEPAQGCGLEGVLRLRRDDLFGVLNGLDYTEWDPAADRHIFRSYTVSALAGKSANKKWLQLLMGLEENPDIPLLGMVTRLTEQKGIDLLMELLPRFATERLQLVILGTGDERYTRALRDGTAALKGKVCFQQGFDPVLASRIYAGSDIFLMPSRYEPCGLGQLIAQSWECAGGAANRRAGRHGLRWEGADRILLHGVHRRCLPGGSVSGA
jgi:starch synthase